MSALLNLTEEMRVGGIMAEITRLVNAESPETQRLIAGWFLRGWLTPEEEKGLADLEEIMRAFLARLDARRKHEKRRK